MFLFIFIDPQISQITQITLKTLRLCARILSTDFTDNTDYDVRLSHMSSKNTCPSVPYVLKIFCSSVPYVSKSSVRLFVCGAKIILFIRIIVVSAYVFSIIN